MRPSMQENFAKPPSDLLSKHILSVKQGAMPIRNNCSGDIAFQERLKGRKKNLNFIRVNRTHIVNDDKKRSSEFSRSQSHFLFEILHGHPACACQLLCIAKSYPNKLIPGCILHFRRVAGALLLRKPRNVSTYSARSTVLGSIAGGAVTTLICRGPTNRYAVALGCLLTLGGIANNLMLPPPLWFWIPTLLLFLPSTWLGVRLVRRTARES